jgi:hypothetical protein
MKDIPDIAGLTFGGIPAIEWFAAPWRTQAQTRDLLIDMLRPEHLTTEYVECLRLYGKEVTADRKNKPNSFVKCTVCGEYHGQMNNVDNLCEVHEAFMAPFRYDNTAKKL